MIRKKKKKRKKEKERKTAGSPLSMKRERNERHHAKVR